MAFMIVAIVAQGRPLMGLMGRLLDVFFDAVTDIIAFQAGGFAFGFVFCFV